MRINLDLHLKTNETLIRLEKHMSALTDAVTKLTTTVAANTTAVNAIPSAAEVATAVTAINSADAQLDTNNKTLAGDVAAPPAA